MRDKVFGCLLHYGMSAVLAAMLVSISYMLQVIEIDNKLQVDVIFEHDGKCYCYLPKDACRVRGNYLPVFFVGDNMEQLKVLNAYAEGQYWVCCVELPASKSARSYLTTNRKVTAYVKVGKQKVIDLVFNKWFDKFRR